jgi:hypothetical protein
MLGDAYRIGRDHRRGFGQPITLKNGHAGGLLPAVGDGSLHRHSARGGKTQTGKVDLGEVGIIEQRVVQGVQAADRRKLVTLQLLDETRDVARVGNQQVAAAVFEHVQTAASQRVDVVER